MAEVKEMTIPLRGMQKPPRKVRVVCTREEGFPLEVKLLEE